ncbi:hypothetical protein ACF1CY_000731 [Providencia rettgeri]
MHKETYLFGQGKVYLAGRGEDGRPLAQRWLGDVSKLSLTLNVENIEHKESYSGNRAVARRLAVSRNGELTMTWHDMSTQNLALLFQGNSIALEDGSVSGEKLPDNIKAGERYSLAHPLVDNVVLTVDDTPLVADTDYYVDDKFGAIEFLTAQPIGPEVAYQYEANDTTAFFTQRQVEVALRYEGVNLAEDGAPVLIELYKVQFDPASALDFINSDNNFAGPETKAGLLMDTARRSDDQLGMFGRLTNTRGKRNA